MNKLAVSLTALALVATAVATGTPAASASSASATVAAAATAAVTGSKATTPRLHREGRSLVDQYGRVVIVHGVNLVWKRAPYAPPDTAEGFTKKDAAWLAKYGFNGARLGVLWAGVTPTKAGVADPAYFDRVDRVADLLSARRIWTLYDMHQDQWHEQYGGEGVPAWAAKRPLPYSAAPYAKVPFPQGYWTPEVSTVFDDFWSGKGGLLTGWADAWRLIALHYRNQPYSMGYDLFNEPWGGKEWPLCLADGCPSTYPRELQPAMVKALKAVRKVDRNGVVWWEPQQFAGGQKLGSYYTAVKGEQNLGFSWHNYCPDVFLASQGVPGSDTDNCQDFTENRQVDAADQATRMNAASLMTEFGATDDAKAIGIDADGADAHQTGWTYWAYKHWDDPTTADNAQGLFTDDADLSTVKTDKLRQLVRTYPQATAGELKAYHYDATTGRFTLTYRADPSIAKPTQVFVSPLTSPHGYVVRASGATYAKHGSTVLLRATKARTVRVTITPRG